MQVKDLNDPDLVTVLEAAKRDLSVKLNAVNIGIIKAFNAANQTASIQIALKQVIGVAPDGTRTIKEHPLLLECPVMTLFGGDSFLSMPIQAGDTCIVLFNDREIDNWLYDGGIQTPSTPRLHSIADAIAIVGIRSFQNSIATYLANGIRLSFSPDSRIDLTEDAINSVAELFTHTGNFRVVGNFYVTGRVYGNGGVDDNLDLYTSITQQPGYEIHAGNGATGSFTAVTVVDGIVISGT